MILSENGHYYTYPNEYYEVWHKYGYNKETKRPAAIKIKDGEGRRSRLWKTGQVLMKLNPSMTKDVLFKVLQRELDKYYENHIDIIQLYGNDRSLEGIVDSVYENHSKYNLKTSKHSSFKINSTYWKRVMSEGNEVYNPIIAVSECKKEITLERISRYYNPGLSVKENYKVLINNNIDISLSTLYRYRRQLLENSSNFSYTHNSCSVTDENIISLMRGNELISIHEIAETLNLSESKVKRIITKLKKGSVIDRIGTKRNYKWVVLTETEE